MSSASKDQLVAAPGRWLWVVVIVATTGLIAHTVFGLVAAMVGGYSTWVILPMTVVATAVSLPWIIRIVPRCTATGRLQPIVMVAVAVGALVYTQDNVGQHVFTGRDPGSYLTTGRWLADNGELRVDVSGSVLDEVPDVSFSGPAVYDLDDGVIEFQFSHGASITMATAYDLGGHRAIFVSSAVIGALALLAVYLALTTVTRSPWLAVAGATGFGLSLPFLYTTRNTYSEPFVLLLLMSALAILLADGRSLRRPQLAFVGLLLGATMLFRIDAQLYVIGLLALATVLLLRGTKASDVAIMIGSAIIPVTVGLIDVRMFAGDYPSDLGSKVRLLDQVTVLMVAVVAGVALYTSLRGRPRFMSVGNPRLAVWVAASIAIIGVLVWVGRPVLWPMYRDPNSGSARYVAGLQESLGIDRDPSRSYSELSVKSIEWYLGAPLVVLAIAGFALIAWRLVAERDTRFVPAAVLMLVGVPLYLYDMRITPDQIWASRRLVPFVLPCFVVAATWSASRLVQAAPARYAARSGVLVVIAASLIIPVVATTWPIRELADQRGSHTAIELLCDELGDDAVVLDTGLPGTPGYFSMATRAWCGAQAAKVAGDGSAAVPAFAMLSREQCLDAFVVGRGTSLDRFGPDVKVVSSYATVNSRNPAPTLTGPPVDYSPRGGGWELGRVVLPAECG